MSRLNAKSLRAITIESEEKRQAAKAKTDSNLKKQKALWNKLEKKAYEGLELEISNIEDEQLKFLAEHGIRYKKLFERHGTKAEHKSRLKDLEGKKLKLEKVISKLEALRDKAFISFDDVPWWLEENEELAYSLGLDSIFGDDLDECEIESTRTAELVLKELKTIYPKAKSITAKGKLNRLIEAIEDGIDTCKLRAEIQSQLAAERQKLRTINSIINDVLNQTDQSYSSSVLNVYSIVIPTEYRAPVSPTFDVNRLIWLRSKAGQAFIEQVNDCFVCAAKQGKSNLAFTVRKNYSATAPEAQYRAYSYDLDGRNVSGISPAPEVFEHIMKLAGYKTKTSDLVSCKKIDVNW